MSALTDLENALTALIAEHTGERWMTTGYLIYAMTTDPETMTLEEPHWITPEGQRTYVTRGLLEQARDELTADITGAFTYVETEEDDDDD
ncbi:hypothetical protein [Cryobacterium sp. BB736]|uniref:hypothetical protein n=1 Tax=Cryobacterium sp. BB736 TaxID=2746963 RepID=UPI00187541F9|nr:hypothetical protein [Cryobacterium sp. BB736]